MDTLPEKRLCFDLSASYSHFMSQWCRHRETDRARRRLLRGGRGSSVILLFAMLLHAVPLNAAELCFRNDVMAILSKAGCNAGACHGNASGKAGFKLSLRGEDLEFDF